MIGSARRILTHDVLATFMAEVSAIINNRPLVSVSTDATTPFILTPATLLTQKTPDACVAREFTNKDLYNVYMRSLIDFGPDGMENTCLPCLQNRRKWTDARPNLKEGDVVLLRDKSVHRK